MPQGTERSAGLPGKLVSALDCPALSLVLLSDLRKHSSPYPSLPGKCQGMGEARLVLMLKSGMERKEEPFQGQAIGGEGF